MSVLSGLNLEKCKDFHFPGTKQTVMKFSHEAGFRKAGFDYIIYSYCYLSYLFNQNVCQVLIYSSNLPSAT